MIGLITLIGGDTWIMGRLLDAQQERQDAAIAALNERLNTMVIEYVIPSNRKLAEVQAQLAVERVLRVCTERPEVCEDK